MPFILSLVDIIVLPINFQWSRERVYPSRSEIEVVFLLLWQSSYPKG